MSNEQRDALPLLPHDDIAVNSVGDITGITTVGNLVSTIQVDDAKVHIPAVDPSRLECESPLCNLWCVTGQEGCRVTDTPSLIRFAKRLFEYVYAPISALICVDEDGIIRYITIFDAGAAIMKTIEASPTLYRVYLVTNHAKGSWRSIEWACATAR